MHKKGEMRINMWYGTVNNSDVEEHLDISKNTLNLFGNKLRDATLTNWEMWQLVNPDGSETTYLYVKFYTEENRKNSVI